MYFDFLFKGFNIRSTTTNTLYIEGSNDPDFLTGAVTLQTIDDYTGAQRTDSIITNLRYIRFRKHVSFTVSAEAFSETQTETKTKSEIKRLGLVQFVSTSKSSHAPDIESSSFVDFVNDFPVNGVLPFPNQRMGFYLDDFPVDFPQYAHSFFNTISQLNDNYDGIFEFLQNIRTPDPSVTIKMGFQVKGAKNQWFDVSDDVGTIKSMVKV